MIEKRNILITGINGFVGGAVLDELRKAGRFEISGLVGRQQSVDSLSCELRVKSFQADISDEKTVGLAHKFGKTDILIHTAGLAHQFGRVEKVKFRNVNAQGTENICRLAKEIGVEHFILISSVAVYGASDDKEIDESVVCNPKGDYAESKFESESRAIEFCEQNKIRLTIIRLATVIGEGDRGNTARLITSIDRGRFVWIGNGDNKKSLIYKRDVAKGILKIVESQGNSGVEIYNLTGESISMREIVGEISRSLQKKAPSFVLPERWIRGIFWINKTGFKSEFLGKYEKTFEKWLSNDIFSGAKFNEKFNFTPETPVTEGLARQANYYLKEKKSGRKK